MSSNAQMTQPDGGPCTNGVAKLLATTAASACHESLAAPAPRPAPRSDSTYIRTLPEICYTLRRKLVAFLAETPDDEVVRDTQDQVRVAMGVIEEALQRYGHEQLSLAYNGGKDCLVLLILILACLPSLLPARPEPASTTVPEPTEQPQQRQQQQQQPQTTTPQPPPQQIHQQLSPPPSSPLSTKLLSPQLQPAAAPASSSPQPLQAIYIAPPDPFPEVEDFVTTSTKQYHLDLVRYALPMRRALEAYLGDRPSVAAIFMGTRRTDPHSEFLTHFSPTDADWPQFMRVNPLIDWHYTEIWTFIRHLGLPYCCLYDQGFSSLGGVTNTRPNPALALGSDPGAFRPAYELVRDDEERLGRDR